jgi:hypothetical protein
MAKVLDEQSRKAVAATVRYYRDLGIYDLYQRDVPEGMTFGQTIVREELAAIAAEEDVASASWPTSPPRSASFARTLAIVLAAS